jgi:hypothetical protein
VAAESSVRKVKEEARMRTFASGMEELSFTHVEAES